MSEKCVWRSIEHLDLNIVKWESVCGFRWSSIPGSMVCPHCGRQIDIKEDTDARRMTQRRESMWDFFKRLHRRKPTPRPMEDHPFDIEAVLVGGSRNGLRLSRISSKRIEIPSWAHDRLSKEVYVQRVILYQYWKTVRCDGGSGGTDAR